MLCDQKSASTHVRKTTLISNPDVNFAIFDNILDIISCITPSTLLDLWPLTTYWSQFHVCDIIRAFLKKSRHVVKKSGQQKEICLTCNATGILRVINQRCDLVPDPSEPKPRVFFLHRLHHFFELLLLHILEPTFAKGVPITKVRVLKTIVTETQLIGINLFCFFSIPLFRSSQT